MSKNEKRGRLYVVSTHIGNIEDVTVRAVTVLKLSDLVICEEVKIGSVLLKKLQINKKLDTLNEQNEAEKVTDYVNMMLEEDRKLALISDCGTPVFADPGYSLVKSALQNNIEVIVVPGATSLMTALVRSGFPLNQFLYAGFLSRKSEERTQQLAALSKEPRTVAVYDTPYRLLPLLEDANKVMPNRQVYIGMNLTMPFETHHYGTFAELYEKFKAERIKAEFVICFEGNGNPNLEMPKFTANTDKPAKSFHGKDRDKFKDKQKGFPRRNDNNKPRRFDDKKDKKDFKKFSSGKNWNKKR